MQPPPNQAPYGGGASPYGVPPNPPYPGPYGAPQQPYGAPQQWNDPQAVPQPGSYGLQCRFCGCVPATETTFRGHRGMILIMSFLSLKGPFCRDCGLATFRDMTAKTLLFGWWGYISFVATPVTVLINLTRRGSVANLPQPMPPPDGRPHQYPADPGAPLLSRPMAIIGLLVPFLLFVLLVIAVALG